MHNISSIVAFGITGRLRLLRKPERCRWEIGAAQRSEKRAVCALPPRLTDGWQLNRGHSRRLGSYARLGNDRDDPARRVAGLNFHDRTDQPRDERSLQGQGCFLAAMLIVAAASRDFCVDRLKRLHALPRDGRRNGSTRPGIPTARRSRRRRGHASPYAPRRHPKIAKLLNTKLKSICGGC